MRTTALVMGGLFVISGTAWAGARIDLRPSLPMPPEGYEAHTVLQVEAYLVDTGNPMGDIVFRGISLRLADSEVGEGFAFAEHFLDNNPPCCDCAAYFVWEFHQCGICLWCPGPAAVDWQCFSPDPFCAAVLPNDGELLLGHFEVNVGTGGGTIDVLDSDAKNPNHSARVEFGLGGAGDPVFIWNAAAGDLTGEPLVLTVNPESVVNIIGSNPPVNSIDARQPTDLNGSTEFGWDSVDLQFDGSFGFVTAGHFEILETGGDGVPPDVIAFEVINSHVGRVTLSEPIEPGTWTVFHYLPNGSFTRLGYLPGDVNADRTTSPVDILALIDSLNGVAVRPIWSTDIDRSGVANPADILRLIDLLNGAGAFDVWNGKSLP